MRATAILVAAGSGARFGSPNKAFSLLAGRPVIAFSLDAFEHSQMIDTIVVVAGPHTLEEASTLISSGCWRKASAVVTGGERRQDSVRLGLDSTASSCEFVAIHDAARPLVRTDDIDRCVEAAVKTGAAILAVPVTDTIKRAANGRITATVPREDLWAAQTPQVFATDRLRQAFEMAVGTELNVTDEATLFESLGFEVSVVRGSSANIKITVPEDLELAEALLSQVPVNRLGGWPE